MHGVLSQCCDDAKQCSQMITPCSASSGLNPRKFHTVEQPPFFFTSSTSSLSLSPPRFSSMALIFFLPRFLITHTYTRTHTQHTSTHKQQAHTSTHTRNTHTNKQQIQTSLQSVLNSVQERPSWNKPLLSETKSYCGPWYKPS